MLWLLTVPLVLENRGPRKQNESGTKGRLVVRRGSFKSSHTSALLWDNEFRAADDEACGGNDKNNLPPLLNEPPTPLPVIVLLQYN